MLQLLDSLLELVISLLNVLEAFVAMLVPWIPLIAWVALWLLAVNWVKFREVLVSGGWTGLLLIGFCMILIWGLIAPPIDGYHFLFGLKLSNFVGKTVYTTALFSIMFMCGSVQLAGVCNCLINFDEPEPEDDHSHGHAAH